MFVEVLLGRTSGAERLQQAWSAVVGALDEAGERWLGATGGTAADGTFVGLLTFESEEGARITLDHLAERGTWQQLGKAVADLTFRECPEVRAFGGAHLGDATLVHIQRGTARDAGRLAGAFAEAGAGLRRRRGKTPALGGLLCWDSTGAATIALYESRRDEASEERFSRSIAPFLDDAVRVEIEPAGSIVTWVRVPREAAGSDDGSTPP
jgi:hypothetical protein